MPVNQYYKGQTIKCSGSFQDPETATYVDPTTVRFRWLRPDNVPGVYTYLANPELTRLSLGNYRALLYLDMAGYWHLRWEGTGLYNGAMEWSVKVCEPAWPLW